MARTRVFVSSTFYDLKHIRASLENFIESFGFDAILFERGDIPFHPDRPLDQSCYQEAEGADIFVLIIGGRYGSKANNQSQDTSDNPETYQSITRKEFETAQNRNIPTFILVENAVMTEYRTFLRNRSHKDITYAHVDNTAIFHFIDSILEKPRNNPVFGFEKSTQVENWLREQWSGLFRDLLQSRSQTQQFLTLNSQIRELKTVNSTLKTYMEEIIRGTNPKNSEIFIKKENEKINLERELHAINDNTFCNFLEKILGYEKNEILNIIKHPTTVSHALNLLSKEDRPILESETTAQQEYNKAREALNLPPLNFKNYKQPHPINQ